MSLRTWLCSISKRLSFHFSQYYTLWWISCFIFSTFKLNTRMYTFLFDFKALEACLRVFDRCRVHCTKNIKNFMLHLRRNFPISRMGFANTNGQDRKTTDGPFKYFCDCSTVSRQRDVNRMVRYIPIKHNSGNGKINLALHTSVK